MNYKQRFDERHPGRRQLYDKLRYGGLSKEQIKAQMPPIGICPIHGDTYMSCRGEHGINIGGPRRNMTPELEKLISDFKALETEYTATSKLYYDQVDITVALTKENERLQKRVEELEQTLGLTLHRNVEQGERIATLEAELNTLSVFNTKFGEKLHEIGTDERFVEEYSALKQKARTLEADKQRLEKRVEELEAQVEDYVHALRHAEAIHEAAMSAVIQECGEDSIGDKTVKFLAEREQQITRLEASRDELIEAGLAVMDHGALALGRLQAAIQRAKAEKL